MNQLIQQIIRAAMKGEIQLDVKSKGSTSVLKKGKLTFKLRECEITITTDKEFK